jgi:hypothetical protein
MSTCVTGTAILTNNVIAGATCANYPATNICPANDAAYQAEFVDYAGGNYRLDPGSAYQTASSTGGPLGADIDTLYSNCVDVAVSGDNTGLGGHIRLHHRIRIRQRGFLENLLLDGLRAIGLAE